MAVDYEKLASELYPVGMKVIGGPMEVVVSAIVAMFGTPFISLQEVVFTFANGNILRRMLLLMPNDGLVIPVLPNGKICMVYMFRSGIKKWAWEFPQIRMDDGESVRDAALRCVRQEVGIVGEPTDVVELKPYPSMPDRVTEMVRPSIVKGDFDFAQRTSVSDVVMGASFTPAEIRAMINNEEVVCPVCITGFDRYMNQ